LSSFCGCEVKEVRGWLPDSLVYALILAAIGTCCARVEGSISGCGVVEIRWIDKPVVECLLCVLNSEVGSIYNAALAT
jgi:hypothetical protein